jgi:hypothetical protein
MPGDIARAIKPESEAKMPVDQIAISLAVAAAFLCLAAAMTVAATAHAPRIARAMVAVKPLVRRPAR